MSVLREDSKLYCTNQQCRRTTPHKRKNDGTYVCQECGNVKRRYVSSKNTATKSAWDEKE